MLKVKHLVWVWFVIGSLLFPTISQAATIYPSPSSGNYNVGQSFSLTVYVSSPDQEINAVSGNLRFPTDKLEVASISTNSSIVDLWVQQPDYSNTNGNIIFEGILFNPGFEGSGGNVLTVNFKTKGAGLAEISFTSASVLANDGQGTNVVSGLGTGRISINIPSLPADESESETPEPASGLPPAPEINSKTHSNPENWYSHNQPSFNWTLAEETTAVRLLVSNDPRSAPSVSYVPPISYKTLDPLEDGTWYFHVRLQNNIGWGGITHYKFQIDTTKPEYFNITPVESVDPTEPTRSFIFEAKDSTSGIDHYKIKIDYQKEQEWQDDNQDHIYTTPILPPGSHSMIVKATDKAGNSLTNVIEFNIEPIDAPSILQYPNNIQTWDVLTVLGETYPNSQIEIWLQREKEDAQTYLVSSGQDGKFTFIPDKKLDDGIYNIWFQTIDQRGARSEITKKYKIVVSPPRLVQLGIFTVDILSVIIPLLALILLLIFIIFFGWKKIKRLQTSISKETGEAKKVLHTEFKNLYLKLSKYVAKLDKASKTKKLTKDEKWISTQLKKDLQEMEGIIGKEIKDIEKEINE